MTTQFSHVIKKVEKQEQLLEDAARLLCQALVGDGIVYVYGKDELEAVVIEALNGQNRLEKGKRLSADSEIHYADRALLFSRNPEDEETVKLAKRLYENQVPFVAITIEKGKQHPLDELADVYISLDERAGGLIPLESGKRGAFPHTVLALYMYVCIRYFIDDIMAEYE